MAFYTAVFGWEWDVSGEEMDFYCIANCSGRAVMGLGQAPEGSGVMVPYFSTDDVDASTKKAEEMGATVVMAPMDVMDIGSMAMLIDPTGAVHGLWQPKTFQGFDIAQWNPIFVTDSLARVRDLVRSLGATVVLEEMEVPGSAISVFVEPVMQTAITIMAAGHPPE